MNFDVEQKIHDMLGHFFPDIKTDKMVMLGVNHEAWVALGGVDETKQLTFTSGNRVFLVTQRGGLGHGEIALIWQ